jgi:hypothetical protein
MEVVLIICVSRESIFYSMKVALKVTDLTGVALESVLALCQQRQEGSGSKVLGSNVGSQNLLTHCVSNYLLALHEDSAPTYCIPFGSFRLP